MCECNSELVRSDSACQYCGGPIWTKPNKDGSARRRKYCSKKCIQSAANERAGHKVLGRKRSEILENSRAARTRVCIGCGVEYVKRRHLNSNQGDKYCSRECYFKQASARKAAKRVFVTRYRKTCEECGSRLWSKRGDEKYCSKSCGNRAASKRKRLLQPMPGFFCKECGTAYVSLHRGKTSFCSKTCSKRHGKREARRKYGRKHRARARRFGVEYEPVHRTKVFERDGWRCQICGRATPEKYMGSMRKNAPELDHRIPLSRGGPHTYDNVQCACRECNGAKSNALEVGQMPLFSIG